MSLLEIRDLGVQLGGKRLVQALSLTLQAGELVGLIGPNGAGKSSLVKAIAQLLPYSGQIRLDGRPLEQIATRERAQHIAYLSQDDRVQWPIRVRDLVALGRHPYRGSWWRGGVESPADRAAIEEALRATDVWELRERRADSLSGGERARARLARVLAVRAGLILADEPVAALDPRHQLQVMALLRRYCDAGASVLLVLHDLTLASRFCDRLLLLHQGEEVAAGTVAQVLTAQHLASVYGIAAVMGMHHDQTYVVPWSCASTDAAAGRQTGEAGG